ncbi:MULTISPECIES: adenosine deaminase [unclassified Arthrobacter]|uniref:adenosine deaminase n=1 Tax=unclassified Arthrobacter TaxID=235627 RepID=UPI001D13D70C|nr:MULTISPECIES: adenosine deaminase [unclassified Arthrobacter]MCC3277307.1 adenosine deaminase [Arthrobacter sp. zg-Y20]MCC9178161.1 adenosine deaminase [Arthrobacter sp. zg-Y750]MDK1317467.1 adenosine deaminase [Arthrobacter sp. zg.Y20]WIB07027.1 adenosine deaminase [Arthrobacter sp. zg-Y20]
MTEPTNPPANPSRLDVRSLPKVSLHDHLDGGLRPATIVELAAAVGHALPATDPAELGEWFRAAADSGSLPRYLETFDHTIAVMQTRDGLSRVAREFVEDLVADGVVYAEVRWAPEQHVQGGLSLDDAVEAVQAGIDEAVANAEQAGSFIQVGQLITAMRHADRAMEIAELALRHRDSGAVGFDIAGPEDGFGPSRFKDAFTFLAEHQFPITVHAGEAAGIESIVDALVHGRALRLGHGVRIAEDIDVEFDTDAGSPEEPEVGLVSMGRVASWVRDRGIALEVCPSSNLQTGAVASFGEDIETHPIDLLYQTGFAVTVNTDNRLMSSVTLTGEFELLMETFEYDLDDILELTMNAVNAAFLPLDERAALSAYVTEGFNRARG